MRKYGRLLLLAVLLSLPADPAGGRGEEELDGGIRGLLLERARAMLEGDRAAFLRTVDAADPEFLRRQRYLFDGFQRLGLSQYRLDLRARLWPELTTTRDVTRYGASARPTLAHVEERYALRGYDAQPAVEDLFLTFVRRPQGWRVVTDSDLDDLTLYSGRKLWEFGPVVVRSTEHFLYVSHPDLAGVAPSVLERAEEALDALNESWSLPWEPRVVIFAPSSAEELSRLIQATFDLDVFVAFAASGIDRSSDWDLVGHRIILNWENFSAHDPSTQRAVFTHELLHVATREYSGPLVPVFVEEGLAEWVTGHDSTGILAGQVQAGLFDRQLPLDHEFVSGSDALILSAYQESSSAIRYAAERFGEAAVADFYKDLGSVRRNSGTWRYHVGHAMQKAFGIGFGEFQRQWARWVESTLK